MTTTTAARRREIGRMGADEKHKRWLERRAAAVAETRAAVGSQVLRLIDRLKTLEAMDEPSRRRDAGTSSNRFAS